MARKLPRSFYGRSTLDVARDLLGKLLCVRYPEPATAGRIVEVEAYRNRDDLASHAYRGITPRNEIMFGKPGMSYVYFIYGMYYCFNIVTEKNGTAGACLIRALEPIDGISIMMERRRTSTEIRLTNGPGKLCTALGIGRTHNGVDLTGNDLFLADDGYLPSRIGHSTRIGIRHATDKPWRFFIKDHPCLSR